MHKRIKFFHMVDSYSPYIILSHGRTVCILDTVSSNNKNYLFVDHLRV